MLDQITPLILTCNEAPNIGRTLSQLTWAKDIVVIDSYSQDKTCDIVSEFSQTRLFKRVFDGHSNQWNFGLKKTGIDTEWVLALDADYILTDDFIHELRTLNPSQDVSGYQAGFTYCVYGQPLHGTVYPPVTILYRRRVSNYLQDGHTHRISVPGAVESLSSSINHDDRKSIVNWVGAQSRYMQLEKQKLLDSEWQSLRWPDKIRSLRFFAPFLMLIYCLIIKGVIGNGKIGIFYAFQRMFAEMLLSIYLIEHDIKKVLNISK